MDWLDRMNSVLDYIEEHLGETIDYEQMASLSLCPGNLFQRMFSNLTGTSLSEYIRRRRLSQAGMDLSSENVSVIDTALKFGYESADAFANAFKRQHGIPPSQAKIKGVILTHYPRLSFTLKIKGELEMKYKLVEKEGFTVVGKSLKTTQEENLKTQSIPRFWDRCNHDGTGERLCAIAPNQPLLGVCYGDEPDGTFRYMIGTEAKGMVRDFEVLRIPKATWAVFESVGPMPVSIQKVWNAVFQEFLPTSKYEHAPIPDFELYPDEGKDTNQADYRCEVWIPVIAKR